MITIDKNHPTIRDLNKVKPEFMNDRPLELSLRHRAWGYHMTACDLDFMEYDGLTSEPVALLETKHGIWNGQLTSAIKAQRKLADRAQLPYFVVEWVKDFHTFTVTPINDIAHQWMPAGQIVFTEREYIEFLYTLKNREHCRLTDRAWDIIYTKANELSPLPEQPAYVVPPVLLPPHLIQHGGIG